MSSGNELSTRESRASPLAPSSRAASDGPPSGVKSSPMMCVPARSLPSDAMAAARLCSITRAFADASDGMYLSSGPARRQLSGTSIAPSRAQA